MFFVIVVWPGKDVILLHDHIFAITDPLYPFLLYRNTPNLVRPLTSADSLRKLNNFSCFIISAGKFWEFSVSLLFIAARIYL